jgi:hypothetical protein
MNTITLKGKIFFDLKDLTKKHQKQSSWKKTAMVLFEPDRVDGNRVYNGICEYYCWFVKKRFDLDLTTPIRGAHVSFINDHVRDMKYPEKWEEVKNKWEGKEVEVVIDLRPHTSTKTHWWFIVPHSERGGLQSIRNELGMDKPYYGMHMTIGRAVDKTPSENYYHWNDRENKSGTALNIKKMNEEHSKYIIRLLKDGFV